MSSGLKLYYRALLLALMGLFLWGYGAAPAQAACASPSGVAGELLYDDGDSVMTYCDGTNWIEFPKVAGGGGGAYTGLKMTHIEAGNTNTCAIYEDGTAWCWGWNDYGEFGTGNKERYLAPVQVGTAASGTLWSDWMVISAGMAESCGIRSDGSAWCWGDNWAGEIGNNSTQASLFPTRVGTSGTGTLWSDWSDISTGNWRTSCGLRSSGTAWCWGEEAIGNNLSGGSLYPAQVGTSGTGTLWSDWVDIDVGKRHVCGLRSNGTMWCWGENNNGQIGNNTTNWALYPVQVGTVGTSTVWNDWTQLSAGDGYTCGLRSNGTAWCWGRNFYGMLGNGNTTDQHIPTQVGTSGTGTLWSDWSKISAAGASTCGIRTNGTAWCWGDNDFGELGNGNTTDQHVPAQVGTSGTGTLWSDWSKIVLSCGIRDNGSAWCWGRDDYVGVALEFAEISYPASVILERDYGVKNPLVNAVKGGGSPWNAGSFTLSDQNSLLVCIATLGTVTDVSWNGQSLTAEASNTGSGVNTYIYALHGNAAATSDITVTLSGTVTAALVAGEGFNFLASPLDQTVSANGSTSTASSGFSGTTQQADETLFGCYGANGPIDDDQDTWSNFSGLGVTGTSGQGPTSNVTASSGFILVNATGSYEAERYGPGRPWAVAMTTYKSEALELVVQSGGGGGSGCSSPTGVAGMMLYDTGDDVMTYCNGSSWVEAGPNPGNGGAGCSSPSGVAGSMIYDNGDSVLTYCDGANWIEIGK